MQDKAIAAIGEWQLEESKNLEQVDLYIENMFPGKDYQILLIVFEIENKEGELICEYKGIDIEKVSFEKGNYKKFAYRKGSARGGDVTFSTKISSPVNTKISGLKNNTFKKILGFNEGKHQDIKTFHAIKNCFIKNEKEIVEEIDKLFEKFTNDERASTGLSFKIIDNKNEKYLSDYELIKEVILFSGSATAYTHAGTVSKSENKVSSVSGFKSNNIYGFAAPFKYSSPDKPGFISGFFNKKLNWRNYPISSEEVLKLEVGRKYIKRNLTGYFYGNEYMIVPHPVIKTNTKDLKNITTLLKATFDDEKQIKKERKKRAEDRVLKIIAEQKNYFNLDILFFVEDKKTGAIKINMMLEDIMPSRFRKLFIDAPEKVNKNQLFKDSIVINKELQDLVFSYRIVKDFFDKNFLDVVYKLFLGKNLSLEYI